MSEIIFLPTNTSQYNRVSRLGFAKLQAARHPIHLVSMFNCAVRVWCIGSGFPFSSSYMANNITSVLCTCMFTYTYIQQLYDYPQLYNSIQHFTYMIKSMNHNSLGCEQPYITHRPRCKNGSHPMRRTRFCQYHTCTCTSVNYSHSRSGILLAHRLTSRST